MNLLYYLIFSFALILALILLEKKFGKDIIFLFGIGSIINGSIFHFLSFPVQALGLVFGLDYLLAPIFFYCLYFMFKKDKAKSAKTMLVISVLSLGFSAIMQFVASVLSKGFSTLLLNELISFGLSTASFLICGFLLIFLLEKLKNNIIYLFLSLFVVSALNFIIFYFSRLIIFQTINWTAFASFFIFNFIFNLAFVLFNHFIKRNNNKKHA